MKIGDRVLVRTSEGWRPARVMVTRTALGSVAVELDEPIEPFGRDCPVSMLYRDPRDVREAT